MKKTISIETEDRDSLERLHYLVESTASLINRLVSGVVQSANAESALEKYLEKHAEQFMEYEKEKSRVSAKYHPDDMPEDVNWSVDFERKTITYEARGNAPEA